MAGMFGWEAGKSGMSGAGQTIRPGDTQIGRMDRVAMETTNVFSCMKEIGEISRVNTMRNPSVREKKLQLERKRSLSHTQRTS